LRPLFVTFLYKNSGELALSPTWPVIPRNLATPDGVVRGCGKLFFDLWKTVDNLWNGCGMVGEKKSRRIRIANSYQSPEKLRLERPESKARKGDRFFYDRKKYVRIR
jgi:hypothetical protein